MTIAIAHVPLKFGLVADVVTDDASDRVPPVPPPAPPSRHHDRCPCDRCVIARASTRPAA